MRFLLAFVGFAALSGCGYFTPPIFFNLEVSRVKAEAARRFPVGSDAAEFEAWFTGKGSKKWPVIIEGCGLQPLRVKELAACDRFALSEKCDTRSMTLTRVEGCRHEFTADYCVDHAGKLASLKFSEGGVC